MIAVRFNGGKPVSAFKILSRAAIACLLLTSHVLLASQAWAFDYARYKPADLDDVIQRTRLPAGRSFNLASPGIEIMAPQKLRFAAELAQHPQACNTRFLKMAMTMLGVPTNLLDAVPISKCVRIRSARGKVVAMYIQDAMADSLSKEIAVGGLLVVFADLVFVESDGLGFLVNEFKAP